MSETANYGLYLTSDSSERFFDWREKMSGQTDSNMVKIDTALGEKANNSKTVQTVLPASAWTGTTAPYVLNLTVANLTADQNGSISLAHNTSPAQREAARDAMLSVIGQQNGKLIISADGDRPTVDIPVYIVLLG